MSTIRNQKMRIAEERKQNNMNFHLKVKELNKEKYELLNKVRTAIADIVPLGRENAQTASELMTKISSNYMSKKEFVAYLCGCDKSCVAISKTTGGRYRVCSAKEQRARYFYEYDKNGDRIGGLITKREWINVYYLIRL